MRHHIQTSMELCQTSNLDSSNIIEYHQIIEYLDFVNFTLQRIVYKKFDAFSSIYCKDILYYFDEDMGVPMVRKGNLLVFT